MTALIASEFSVSRGAHTLLSEISCTVAAGQLLGICGPNGAGKTTLLRGLAGLLRGDSGTVTLNGRALHELSLTDRARQIGYLAQGPQIAWPLTVVDLVALGRQPHRVAWHAPTPADQIAVERALRSTNLEALRARSVSQLSGGERMRAHLARLLAGEHRILLLDEPTASLDPRHQLEVMATLKTLADGGLTVAVVLHDLTLATRYCTELLVLHHGSVTTRGAPALALDDACLADVFGVRAERVAGDQAMVGFRPLHES
ncbi:MAG: ABC transporter ATP-binding protein [Gammaproteobacteria bacterium]|nr:ABC transporter ATP-binding protein [Gammaproteobacteria bacterium]